MREKIADSAPDQANSQPPTTDGTAEGQPQGKPKRSRFIGLSGSGRNRSRSHSRYQGVTDQGQTGASIEDLSKTVPPLPTLAQASAPASKRQASPLPSPTIELSSPHFPEPDVIVSDNPLSPVTLIPATDTLSTRPTKGGIAYPFSLKVGGEGKDVNASTLTLQSINITTPLAVDVLEDKQLEAMDAHAGSSDERSFTAAPGATVISSKVEENAVVAAEKIERPPVERFETAQEDLNLIAITNKKL